MVMVNRVIAAKLLKIKKRKRTLPRHLSAEAVSVSRYDANHPAAISTRKFRSPGVIPGESDFIISTKALSRYAKQVGMPIDRAREVVNEFNQLREQERGLDHEAEAPSTKQYNSMAQAKAALREQPTVRKPNMDKSRGAVRDYQTKNKRPDKTFARPEFYEPEVPVAPFSIGVGTVIVNGEPTEEMILLTNWANWKKQGNTLFVRMNVMERTNYTLDLWFYGDKVYFFELDYNKKLGRRSRNYYSVNRAQKEMDYIRWVEEIPIE